MRGVTSKEAFVLKFLRKEKLAIGVAEIRFSFLRNYKNEFVTDVV